MNGDRYIPGAITLYKSIRQYNQSMDIVCLVTDDVTPEGFTLLKQYFTHVIQVERISVKNPPPVGGTKAGSIYTWNSDAPTKWNILALPYKKVLFLDADMIVLDKISELFELPCPAAVFDHQTAKEYVDDVRWLGDREGGGGFINYYKAETSGSEFTTGTLISRDIVSQLRNRSNTQFSLQGGLVLVEPNEDLFNEFKKRVQSICNSLKKLKYCHAQRQHLPVRTDRTLSAIDEITLALFYHDMGYTWTHIDMRYNVSAYHTYPIFANSKERKVKIIHYISPYKPWNVRPSGISEREYIRRAAFSKDRNIGYKSHHKCMELWWKYYEL